MTADEAAPRIAAALAEAGYPGATIIGLGDGIIWRGGDGNDEHSHAAWWAAVELSGYVPAGYERHPCWTCYIGEPGACYGWRCAEGNCSHPDEPRWPPRDLLRRPEPAR